MSEIQKWGVVTRFELEDAFRSKLVMIVVGVYAAGAALGSTVFIKSVQAMERSARAFLAEQTGGVEAAIPLSAVREQAMTLLLQSVDDEALRQSLAEMNPLAIFYGYMSLLSVPLLILAVSAGSHAADIQSGAARFALFRCSRAVWVWGKFTGHAALLAVGLLVGAGVAGLIGSSLQANFEIDTLLDLFLASLRSWVYGMAFLGIFSGISLATRAPLRARAYSLFALMGMTVAHAIFDSDWLVAKASWIKNLVWLFPTQYKVGLWLDDPARFSFSLVGLLAISALGVYLGTLLFERRDA